MKKFILLAVFILITISGANADTIYYNNAGQPVAISYDYGLPPAAYTVMPMAKQVPPPPMHTKHVYMTPGMYYRTGYARPKTRFAQPNKRFAQPQTHFAHVRPKYIYTTDYQDNISNKHNPGMKRQFESEIKTTESTISRFNKNYSITQSKKVSCAGVTYYGVEGACK
ncbi:hypothetical protein IJ541_06715 [bacterium]|nr:hypothetical protein [bacterium]